MSLKLLPAELRPREKLLARGPAALADALLEYYDIGVDHFLIRGFDPLDDASDYGRALIPLTRELVARRIANQRRAA
mgnify:CR=1 FL=1